MIGGVSIAAFAIIALSIWITILKDRLKQTEAELDEVTEERDRAREYNIYWRGHEKLITNYQEMSDHFRTDWEAKVNENAALIAEKDAYDKFRKEYVEKCVRYFEEHHRPKDDQDNQGRDKDGNYSNDAGVSKDQKRRDAYLLWKAKGFPSEEDWPGIYDEIGKSLKLKASTVKQYIREYVKGDGRYDYNRDRQQAEREEQNITTLPQAQ